MQSPNPIRRHLARWLTICFLVQAAWFGLNPAAHQSTTANLRGHHILPTQRVALWQGGRSLQTPSGVHHLNWWQPGIAENRFDFRPQWELTLLAKRQTSQRALLPADTARFGRAPPSSIL